MTTTDYFTVAGFVYSMNRDSGYGRVTALWYTIRLLPLRRAAR